MNQIWQFIIPLGFMAIWALTHLFNREEQPLPPRGGRPLDREGLRPQPNPAPRPMERRLEPVASREPTMRWTPPDGNRPTRPATPVRLDDDIVILDSEPKRPAAPVRPARGTAPKRGARSRPTSAQPPKKADAAPPRLLSAPLSKSIAPLASRPFEITPLELSKDSLWNQDSTLNTAPLPGSEKTGTPAPLSASGLRALVRSPEKLRENLILTEILQPPLALRPRRR